MRNDLNMKMKWMRQSIKIFVIFFTLIYSFCGITQITLNKADLSPDSSEGGENRGDFTLLNNRSSNFSQNTIDERYQKEEKMEIGGGVIGQSKSSTNLPSCIRHRPVYLPQIFKSTEFETYVSNIVGEHIPIYGSELAKDAEHTFSPPSNAAVPNDYIINSGDEIFVRIWGSIDANFHTVVDRQGQIVIPKIGAINVSGMSYGKLSNAIQSEISKTYSGVHVSTSIGHMRGIRVYVTGYALFPGAYTVNNLSSLVNVIMAAGGPSSSGSYRNIQLKRHGRIISQFDLYELLLKGDKSHDRVVTAEDIIHIGPSGPQVAITGAINKPAIFEIKKGETLQDILKYAGGFLSGAYTNEINYMGLNTRRDGFRVILKPDFQNKILEAGDVYIVTSGLSMKQPVDKQMRMIKVDGQVNNPGMYVLPAGSVLQDAIDAAGGLSEGAYIYGARLERTSVRLTQEENLKRFLREFKRDVEGSGSIKVTNAEDAVLGKARREQGQALLKNLQELKVDGRMTLSLEPNAKELPNILIESGDILSIPMKSNSVTVLGSINGGQVGIAYNENKSIKDYIKLAGGYSRGAERSNVYVMRASGEFISANGWLGVNAKVMPGDAIFVPENLQKTNFVKELKDWTSIMYQLGITAAAIKVLGN